MAEIKFDRPIRRLDGTLCTGVTMREWIEGGDLLAQQRAEDNDLARSFALAGSLCGLDMAEVSSMDLIDIRKITKAAETLLDRVNADPKE